MEFGDIISTPKPNIELTLDETGGGYAPFVISFYVKRNLANRFKYWLFCQFFPFKRKWVK